MGLSLFGGKKSSRADTGGRDRRTEARFATESTDIRCALGQLADLSTGGMRVLCARKPAVVVGQVVHLELRSGGARLPLRAQVVRVARLGLRQFDVGLRFGRVGPTQREQLEHLARFGFIREPERKPVASEPKPATPLSSAIASMPNPYSVLGVSHHASQDAIHRAYRDLARRLHPDHNPEPSAAEHFELVCRAYRVLQDASMRAAYDRLSGPGNAGAA